MWAIDDMWGDDESDETPQPLEDVLSSARALSSLIEGAFFGEERSLFNLESKSLMPLCRIESTEEAVTVTFDLPRVEKRNITLTSTENAVSVEAKMRKPITLRVGGSVQKHVAFERYRALVRLPRKVEPERAKATFKNGLLRVRFPIAKKGNRVRIG